MKEKNLIIQKTKSILAKKEEPKQIAIKSKNTSMVKQNEKSSNKKAIVPKETAKSKTTVKKQTTTKKKEKKTIQTTNTSKSKKTNFSKNTSTKNNLQIVTAHANEYFDLPYRYNETIVKLLVQTPKKLFVYWDISDKDRENYIKTFGEDFFNKTTPFLKVKNETKNYTFDLDINDFANSWYIDINDDDCKYSVELYRKFKDTYTQPETQISFENEDITAIQVFNNSIFITSSNDIIAPNNKILSTTYPRIIKYKNIKTNSTHTKTINKSAFEFYNTFFKEELAKDDLLNNPSSR